MPTDGCITKAPGGGEVAGRSPVDRGKQGRKRSVATDAAGIPLGLVATRANCNDSPLLGPTLHAAITQVGAMPAQITAHLDRGYDNASTRRLLATLGFRGEIARKGVPAPVQAGRRWVVERTHAWMNGYGMVTGLASRRVVAPPVQVQAHTRPSCHDRRAIRREQARSVWGRPDRRGAPGYGSGGCACCGQRTRSMPSAMRCG
jgi:IS5 family transposase